jgi:hypothetical protein
MEPGFGTIFVSLYRELLMMMWLCIFFFLFLFLFNLLFMFRNIVKDVSSRIYILNFVFLN